MPRHITGYSELSADDRKSVDDWNKQTLTNPTFADLDQVRQFNLRNANYPHGWVLQAYLALKMDRETEGREAAQNLIELGGANSLNPTFRTLLVQLDEKGWLPKAQPTDDAVAATPGADPADPAAASDTDAEARKFVQDFIAASNSGSSQNEVGFYAPSVRYFDKGMQGIDFIGSNITQYDAQHDVRQFHLHEDPVLESIDADSYLATCSIDYSVSNTGKTQSYTGNLSDQIAIQKQDGVWKVIGIQNLPSKP